MLFPELCLWHLQHRHDAQTSRTRRASVAPSSTCKQQPDSQCKGLSSMFNLSSSPHTARWEPGGSLVQGTDVPIPQQGERGHSEVQPSNMALSRKSSVQGLSSCLSAFSPAGYVDVHVEEPQMPTCLQPLASTRMLSVKQPLQCTWQTAADNFIQKAKLLH